ncbi:hypothetical protein Tco_0359842 [Tanacetum coccineum]
MTGLLNEPLYTKSTTMTVAPLLETIQETQEDPAKNKNNWKIAVKQRLEDHDQRWNDLSQDNHVEVIKQSIQANVVKEIKTQAPKLLPKVVSDFVQPRLERTVLDVIKKNPINLFQSTSTPTARV